MMLRDEHVRSGEWLFRWRSYPPVVFLLIVLLGTRGYHYPADSHVLDYWWEAGCVLLAVLGLAVRGWAVGAAGVGTSGGDRCQQRAEVLNTTGAYAVVRHPLYLGAFLVWTGTAALTRSVSVVLIVCLVFWIYYERIMTAEEAFLERRFGAAYRDWADRTPAFFPRRLALTPGTREFRWKRVLRRDYSAWLAVATAMMSIELVAESQVHHRLYIDTPWLVGYASVVLAVILVRALKHWTTVLR